MILHIAIGGAIGALARFAIGGWVTTWAAAGFPWGTFTVNVTGSMALGVLVSLPRLDRSRELRAGLTIGLCGGFTTFSTFSYETLVLLQDGRLLLATAYTLLSVSACIAGVLAGTALGTGWLARTRAP